MRLTLKKEGIIVILTILMTYWIWGINWNERYSGEITKFLISYPWASQVRLLLTLILIYLVRKGRLDTILLILMPFLVRASLGVIGGSDYTRQESFTAINVILSLTLMLEFATVETKKYRVYVYHILWFIIVGGIIALFLFDGPCLINSELCSDSAYFRFVGFTTLLRGGRFAGLLGGPITASTVAGIFVWRTWRNDLQLNPTKRNIGIACGIITIFLSGGTSGILIITLLFILNSKLSLNGLLSLKLKKISIKKNSKLIFLFILIGIPLVVLVGESFYFTANLFILKIGVFFNVIFGSGSFADGLQSDVFKSLDGRINSLWITFNELDGGGLILGNVGTVNNVISESGLITLFGIFGIPIGSFIMYLLYKRLGLRMALGIGIFSILYNPLNTFPVPLVIVSLLSDFRIFNSFQDSNLRISEGIDARSIKE